MTEQVRRLGLYESLAAGTVKGWNVAVFSMLPNVVLAFALIHALKISGALSAIGDFFSPVMSIFGLPGEAVAVLISTWFSAGGGVGAAAGLYASGSITAEHASILMPAIFLMGAQIQYAGRILGVAQVDPRHYPAIFAIGIFNAAAAMLTMNLLVV